MKSRWDWGLGIGSAFRTSVVIVRPTLYLLCPAAALFGAQSAPASTAVGGPLQAARGLAALQDLQTRATDQKPVIMLRGNVRGEHVRPLSVNGVYRVIDTAQDATVSGLTIDGVQANVTRDCIRVRGDAITIRNVHCAMMGPPKTSMRFLPEGLHIRGGSNVRVENSSFSGFQTALEPTRYWNGDGVTAERGIAGLSFLNVQSNNNSDAGFDIKSPVEMDGVSASGNCRDYRFWSDATVGTMQAGQTVRRGGISSCAGIWIQGSDQPPGPTIHIRNLVVSTATPMTIILLDGAHATIRVDRCSIAAPVGSTMVVARRGLARVTLDSTCRVR